MDAIGLVLVGLPFWYSRQCRVTVPWAASAYMHPSEAKITLRQQLPYAP